MAYRKKKPYKNNAFDTFLPEAMLCYAPFIQTIVAGSRKPITEYTYFLEVELFSLPPVRKFFLEIVQGDLSFSHFALLFISFPTVLNIRQWSEISTDHEMSAIFLSDNRDDNDVTLCYHCLTLIVHLRVFMLEKIEEIDTYLKIHEQIFT